MARRRAGLERLVQTSMLADLDLDVGPAPVDLPRGQINLPSEIERALQLGAALVVNISGGKDSQAQLRALYREYRRRRWEGDLIAIHADLGRAEWPESLPHCDKLCAELNVEFVVVRRDKGDLFQRIEQRMETLRAEGKTDVPFWPGPSRIARYCTGEMKTNQVDKSLRTLDHSVCALGMRWQESEERKKLPTWEVRSEVNRAGRRAYTWHPIVHWSLDEVWNECGVNPVDLERRRRLYRDGRVVESLDGWPAHPAYVYGNERVSCVICIPYGSRNDLNVGVRHHPEKVQHLIRLEDVGGFTFRSGMSLRELVPAKEDD